MEVHNCSASSLSAPSPTFTSYSSENLGDIAARVVGELNLSVSDDDFYSSLHLNDDVEFPPPRQNDAVEQNNLLEEEDEDEDDDDESEFEFAVVCRDDDNYSSPISADEIFDNGHIRPMFPIFNTDLIYAAGQNDAVSTDQRTIRLPLRKLLTEERESSSSTEADDLDGIPAGTYCVWAPKKKEEDITIGKKSNSTGSCSKRFRIRDLLYNRSNSDGKDTFVFLTPPNHHQGQGGGDRKRREKVPVPAKKKSYLPYRQDLVGFFANVNSVSRTVRPF